jgi:hypothetical protein
VILIFLCIQWRLLNSLRGLNFLLLLLLLIENKRRVDLFLIYISCCRPSRFKSCILILLIVFFNHIEILLEGILTSFLQRSLMIGLQIKRHFEILKLRGIDRWKNLPQLHQQRQRCVNLFVHIF